VRVNPTRTCRGFARFFLFRVGTPRLWVRCLCRGAFACLLHPRCPPMTARLRVPRQGRATYGSYFDFEPYTGTTTAGAERKSWYIRCVFWRAMLHAV
jgi:hypothetical protein